MISERNCFEAESRIEKSERGRDRREGVGKIDSGLTSHRGAGNENLFGKIVMSDYVAVSLVKRKNVLGTAESQAVRRTSADIKDGKAGFETFEGIWNSADHTFFLADGRSRAVAGEDERSFLAVVGIGIGQTKNRFAFGKFLAVKDFVFGRSADFAVIIESRLEKDVFSSECL